MVITSNQYYRTVCCILQFKWIKLQCNVPLVLIGIARQSLDFKVYRSMSTQSKDCCDSYANPCNTRICRYSMLNMLDKQTCGLNTTCGCGTGMDEPKGSLGLSLRMCNTHTYTYVHTYVCICAHMHICVHTCVCTCTHTRTWDWCNWNGNYLKLSHFEDLWPNPFQSAISTIIEILCIYSVNPLIWRESNNLVMSTNWWDLPLKQ